MAEALTNTAIKFLAYLESRILLMSSLTSLSEFRDTKEYNNTVTDSIILVQQENASRSKWKSRHTSRLIQRMAKGEEHLTIGIKGILYRRSTKCRCPPLKEICKFGLEKHKRFISMFLLK